MAKQALQVAIDGPASAGKSTVANSLQNGLAIFMWILVPCIGQSRTGQCNSTLI